MYNNYAVNCMELPIDTLGWFAPRSKVCLESCIVVKILLISSRICFECSDIPGSDVIVKCTWDLRTDYI